MVTTNLYHFKVTKELYSYTPLYQGIPKWNEVLNKKTQVAITK